MSEEKSGKSAEGAKKSIASNEVNFEQMSIQEGSAIELKGIDANRYATKKTVAQGLLDIALLTSNASQLKYILQVGPKHEFYTLLVTLISISIILQLMVGLLFVVIGGMDLNDHDDQPSAVILNDVIVIFIFVISVVNIIISAFGIEYSNNPLVLERLKKLNIEYLKKVSAGILALITSSLNEDTQKKMANWLYHISVGLMTGVIFCDVIKMNFGLDPALSERDHYKNILSSIGSVILGFIFDINHQPHHRRAEILNNLYLGTKTISTTVNVMISVFYSLDVTENLVASQISTTLNAI